MKLQKETFGSLWLSVGDCPSQFRCNFSASRITMQEDSLVTSSLASDSVFPDYSSQSLKSGRSLGVYGTKARKDAGLRMDSLDSADEGEQGRVRLPSLAKNAWASTSSKRVNFGDIDASARPPPVETKDNNKTERAGSPTQHSRASVSSSQSPKRSSERFMFQSGKDPEFDGEWRRAVALGAAASVCRVLCVYTLAFVNRDINIALAFICVLYTSV